MTPRLVEVTTGRCPVCGSENSGRVLEDDYTGACGWECPRPDCEAFVHVQEVEGIDG